MSRGLSKKSQIAELFDALLTVMSNPQGVAVAGGVREYHEMVHWKELGSATRERNLLRNQLRRLEQQHYIQIIKETQGLLIKLNDRGFEEILKRRILSKKECYLDGRLCYISFDIPETLRAARDSLRFLLKRGGFRMLHQSFWYTNRDVGKELAQFIRSLGIEQYVQVIEGFLFTSIISKTETRIQKKIQKKKMAITQIEAEREELRAIGCRISLQ